ncbi:hypothetical protein BN1708_018682, partial [Verticillium longisporum]
YRLRPACVDTVRLDAGCETRRRWSLYSIARSRGEAADRKVLRQGVQRDVQQRQRLARCRR